MVAPNFQRLGATIHVYAITRIKGRHRNKTRMRGALVQLAPRQVASVLYRRPLSFFKDALPRRESTEEHFSRRVYAAQTFFSPPAVWAMQIYTLKLWKATSGRRGGPSQEPKRRLMHSQFLGVARAPSACRSQLENTSPLLPQHLVEILFCILLRVIITRQALSPRSLKVADLTLTCAEFLFRRNITFFRRRALRETLNCV